MSHRETSIHSWLGPSDPAVPASTWDEATSRWSDDDPKTDEEKHLFCRRRTGVCATFIPQAMYDRAAALDCDMRWYVPNRPMPINPVPYSMTRRGNPK